MKSKFLFLALSVFLASCGGGGVTDSDVSPRRTVLLGDSLSAYPAWCESYPTCPDGPVGDKLLELFGGGENLSTAGETTAHALLGGEVIAGNEIRDRKYKTVSTIGKVDTLILRYCVADIVTGLTAEEVFNNINLIVKTVAPTNTYIIKCSPVLVNDLTKLEYVKLDKLIDTIDNAIILSPGDSTEPMPDKMHPAGQLVDKQLATIKKQILK